MKKILSKETVYESTQPEWIAQDELDSLCCGSTPVPQCEVSVSKWGGYSIEEITEKLGLELDDSGRDAQGRLVEIRLVKDRETCGHIEVRYEVQQQNCCDGVPELSWDTEASIIILAPSSSGVVAVGGGKGEYTWTLSGNDVSFAGGRRTIKTSEDYVWLYSGASFCGSADVVVVDACGQQVQAVVRSTAGKWELVYGGSGTSPCLATTDEFYTGCGLTAIFDLYKGRYYVRESHASYGGQFPSIADVEQFCAEHCPEPTFPCVTPFSAATKVCDWCAWCYNAQPGVRGVRLEFYRWQYKWVCD